MNEENFLNAEVNNGFMFQIYVRVHVISFRWMWFEKVNIVVEEIYFQAKNVLEL